MKKNSWLCISLLFLLGVSQYSFAQPAKLIYLKDVNVFTSADSTKIILRFNGPSQEKGVTYKGNFIQVEFPDAIIDPSKQWINVNDELVKNIFLYQFDDNTVRARLFTIGKAENLKDRVVFSRENNRIIIQYNFVAKADDLSGKPAEAIHTVNGQVSAISNQQSVISSRQPAGRSQYQGLMVSSTSAAPSVIGNSESETDSIEQKPVTNGDIGVEINKQVSPVSGESSKKEEQNAVKMPIGIESPGIYSSFLRMVIVLGILISLLLIALFLVKKYFGKQIGIADKNQGIRIITSAYLGPKKSIALVDVSGERIVVGITPNHITMLTRLGKDSEFKDILKEQISSDEKVVLHDELWEKV